ncbi:MAG: DUF393 domain-containing protein [Saprospiraceae bacterium]|nr:DUF393 domain-containing protein [Bacteroidia bacterium]NNE14292.1 DUF393 domain-containing protein [Saprospiraceae bacterium]NNL92128.1 DUF393 domain-containing protein [Saprospiraceae bacterium]
MNSNIITDKNIIFFDGVCTICNSFVDFLISRDKSGKLYFASLQGKTASSTLSASDLKNIDTVIYIKDGKTYYRSDAALLAISSLNGLWKSVLIFRVVPKFIRDRVYNFIAKNRYKWFGKRDACRMPTESEGSQILA